MITILALILIVGVNFIYQAVRLFRRVSRHMFDEKTRHRFQCKKCEETYTLTGPEAKKIRWKPRIELNTPRGQSTAYRFKCPHCHQRTSQYVLYDTDMVKWSGMVRLQVNDEQKPMIIEFLVKGILPFIILSTISMWFF